MNEIYQLQQLDKKLAPVNISKPRKGWLATIRKALGMSQAQFGRRLGVSRARANKIENSELDGSLTLASLERAAHALGCKVHYMLLPENESLVAYVQQQARHIATKAILGAAKQMAVGDSFKAVRTTS